MSIDTLLPSPRRLIKLAETPPSRNSEFRCVVKSSPGTRKPSAVERLEADKVKYVKSQQVALKKQQPVTCPSNNSQNGPGAQQPPRKVPGRPAKSETPPLDLEHLCKLIDGVSDTAATAMSTQPNITRKVQDDVDTCKPLSSILNATEEPFVGSTSTSQGKSEASGVNGCPVMTVRRVDVRPQLPQMRMGGRPQLQSRQTPQPPTSQFPMQLLSLLRPNTQQNQHPFAFQRLQNITNAPRGPIKPPNSPAEISPITKSPSSPFNSLSVPIKPKTEPESCTSPTQITPTAVHSFLAKNDFQPPPSPAITHRSSTSSRKRPSLTRSKSDVSDCFSRAGVELERFFNYCGLNPTDLEELARPGSDIVSVSRLRSASAPASERTAEGDDDEEDDAAKDERPGYGISVIERNARVIKWLYGMRQAKESPKVASM